MIITIVSTWESRVRPKKNQPQQSLQQPQARRALKLKTIVFTIASIKYVEAIFEIFFFAFKKLP